MNTVDLVHMLDQWARTTFDDIYVIYNDIHVRFPDELRALAKAQFANGWIGTLKPEKLEIWTYFGSAFLNDPKCFEKLEPVLRISADFVIDWYRNNRGWMSANDMISAAGSAFGSKL